MKGNDIPVSLLAMKWIESSNKSIKVPFIGILGSFV
jgi:hypothetical protein